MAERYLRVILLLGLVVVKAAQQSGEGKMKALHEVILHAVSAPVP